MTTVVSSAFAEFVHEVEPRLRRALVARFGPHIGREAAADALVYAWQNWGRINEMENPAGYLYRVGVSSVRPRKRPPVLEPQHSYSEPWAEPALEGGLARLSDAQRVAVVLHHSFSWTYEEVAALLEISVSSVRTHIARGMSKLRAALEVVVDG